jgi:histidyl-tRNA synthetase
MAYADKIGVPYIAILGEDEIKEDVAAIKNMASGEQKKLSYQQAALEIKAGLEELNRGTPILDR